MNFLQIKIEYVLSVAFVPVLWFPQYIMFAAYNVFLLLQAFRAASGQGFAEASEIALRRAGSA